MAAISAASILDSLAGEEETDPETAAPHPVSNARSSQSAGGSWRDTAPQLEDDLENDDPSLNSDVLFSDRNFKSGTSGLQLAARSGNPRHASVRRVRPAPVRRPRVAFVRTVGG